MSTTETQTELMRGLYLDPRDRRFVNPSRERADVARSPADAHVALLQLAELVVGA